MLRRILLLIVLLYLAWRMLSAKSKRMHRTAAGADDFSRFSRRSRERRLRQERQQTEQLLPCATCGTFVPTERALADPEGQVYCSELCRQDRQPH